MLKRIFYILLTITGLASVAVGVLLYWFVVLQPGSSIELKNLQKVLAIESPVFYQDGRHKIGVFFQNDHRQYLSYSQIPVNFVKAIVAAEDHNFFSHHGVDFIGIARAMMANIKAGRVVQGGSTLTQQAAKNLFKRQGRSYAAKLKELLYAWRLEYHYSKGKILEFYANQFYVSGNGRGLGVAAKYYFDKDAQDLTVLESAFIAGSVKRPNYYNPFIKRDANSARRARERARVRTQYVIRQMYKMRMISRVEYQRNLGKDVPFRQGKMSYALNTVMDLVKDALFEPEVEEVLVDHGIENIATSGIRVFTTVEKDVQEFGLSALRHELSRLTVRLRGYDAQEMRKIYPKLAAGERHNSLAVGAFLFGHIVAVDIKSLTIRVSLGKSDQQHNEIIGKIDEHGISDVLSALVKFNKQRWTEADKSDLRKFMHSLHAGDLVYVRIDDFELSGGYKLSLERYPEVQGGVLALKDGKITAMIGGVENRFYNRAIDAKRLMGSVTKPFLYTAALQLGWNTADLLNNQRDAFVYQKQVYIPRPDHISPYNWVSMNWAGTKSENVASVWLLYHLCDRLSLRQFKEVLDKVGLRRKSDESYQGYRRRIRDGMGILVDRENLKRLAFKRAVSSLEPDLLFAGKSSDYEIIQHLHFKLDAVISHKERGYEVDARRLILRRTFIKQKGLYDKLQKLRRQLEVLANAQGWLDPDLLVGLLGRDGLYSLGRDRYAFAAAPLGPNWRRLSNQEIVQHCWNAVDRKQFWKAITLDGLLSAETFGELTAVFDQELRGLKAKPAYGPEVLYGLRDFRVLAGLKYLIALCQEMGIKSDLQPVLSFPLGSNVISLLETARAYETVVSGRSYRTGRLGSGDSLKIIERIENCDGEVIYRPDRLLKRVVDPRTALAVSDILRHVVKYGTGRYAYRTVRLHDSDPARNKIFNDLNMRIPLLGKTGTANQFRNSSFVGYVPGMEKNHKEMTLSDGYTLAIYVGYDDNLPMVRSSTHITGSQGALPLWAKLADMLLARHVAQQVDLGGLFFAGVDEIPLAYPDFGEIKISDAVGDEVVLDDTLLTSRGYVDRSKVIMGDDVTTYGIREDSGKVRLQRYYKPFWRSTDDATVH